MFSLFVLAFITFVSAQVDPQTPLQAYCQKPDPAYSWRLYNVMKGPSYDTYIVNLTSQTWLTPADSNIHTWYHWLQISVPHQRVNKGTKIQAGIYADGGDNGDSAPNHADSFSGILAANTGLIMGHLYEIPNQPAYFTSEQPPRRRSEDKVIAYTWSHFLNHTDQPEWLLRLPMVKSVVAAMTCIQEFTQAQGFGEVDGFVIAGASKRGWTTWLTPVVDKRVKAIVPIVMPVLNMQAVINKLWQSLGAWSFALNDYLEMNLMARLNDPEFHQMANIIDPFVYKGTMSRIPKYLIMAAGDEFFIPDATREFWRQLPGNANHLRVVPNAEHSMAGHALRVIEQVATYVNRFNADRVPEPLNYTMVYSNDTASITVWPKTKPSAVTMFQAHTMSSTSRDYRLLTCPKIDPKCLNPVWWLPTTLQPSADGSYTAAIRAPAVGWIGFMIEVTYQGTETNDWIEFTTEVNIVPDRYPFPPCSKGRGC